MGPIEAMTAVAEEEIGPLFVPLCWEFNGGIGKRDLPIPNIRRQAQSNACLAMIAFANSASDGAFRFA
jgi:hypothetical protein